MPHSVQSKTEMAKATLTFNFIETKVKVLTHIGIPAAAALIIMP